jgi:hypothetical protein
MSKFLATCAGLAVTAMLASPAPVTAAEKRADGARTATEQTDVSAQRRHRRHVHRYYGPRYGYRYRARPYYYGAPYYAYAPRPYYRPYYGPAVGVGVGPFGFGFGFR